MIINLYFNTICNFKCSYCYEKNNNWGNELSLVNFLKIINKLKYINNDIIINIMGGEPTIHPQFNLFINHLKKLKNIKQLILYTNGTNQNINYNNFNKIYNAYHSSFSSLSNIITHKNNHLYIFENVKNMNEVIYYCKDYNISYSIRKIFKTSKNYIGFKCYNKTFNINFDSTIIHECSEIEYSVKELNNYIGYITCPKICSCEEQLNIEKEMI